ERKSSLRPSARDAESATRVKTSASQQPAAERPSQRVSIGSFRKMGIGALHRRRQVIMVAVGTGILVAVALGGNSFSGKLTEFVSDSGAQAIAEDQGLEVRLAPAKAGADAADALVLPGEKKIIQGPEEKPTVQAPKRVTNPAPQAVQKPVAVTQPV